ncbi:MAG: glucose-1-phosphate thymidylyltransferase RfbA [Candidatus Neomarinimicrobiota bacterium]
MKGIILAGGSGTRLFPLTLSLSKQLLPVHDKPMIYYPLSTLMLAGIRDILIITTERDQEAFINLLGDGSQWGIKLEYLVQPNPEGLAQAFILGEEFIGNDNVCLILGDNIFHGSGMHILMKNAVKMVENEGNAQIFGYYVKNPSRYGVAELNEKNEVISIEEKPEHPKSHFAVVGMYFYPNSVVEMAKNIKPSARGELEITDINSLYLKNGKLNMQIMDRGYAWLDTGTHEALFEAGMYVSAIEKRQGLKISCPEEIAWRLGFISKEEMHALGKKIGENEYGKYLLSL